MIKKMTEDLRIWLALLTVRIIVFFIERSLRRKRMRVLRWKTEIAHGIPTQERELYLRDEIGSLLAHIKEGDEILRRAYDTLGKYDQP